MGLNDPSVPTPPDAFAVAANAIVPAHDAVAEELDLAPSLPGEHPAWQRDVVAISARVRALVATIKPIAVTVLTFWDHLARSISVGGARRLEIDPSGCYRVRPSTSSG